MKKKQLVLNDTKQNYKRDRIPVLLNGTKYWIFRRYGIGHYMVSEYTNMTLKLLISAGWKGEIPMTKKWSGGKDILPEMEIDKGLCMMTLPENQCLLHLI